MVKVLIDPICQCGHPLSLHDTDGICLAVTCSVESKCTSKENPKCPCMCGVFREVKN
jgi:hypothetical protein